MGKRITWTSRAATLNAAVTLWLRVTPDQIASRTSNALGGGAHVLASLARMNKPAFLILAVILSLFGVAWATGTMEALSEPALIQARIAQAGVWGPLLFVALAVGMFAVLMLSPAVWAAAAVWPLPLAIAYSFVAALLGSVLTYAVAHRLGKDWAQDRIPASLRRWEERLRARPFLAVIALRFLLWANPFVDLFAALAHVPPRTYLLATTLGLLPPTVFQVLLGVGGLTVAAHLPWWGWVLAATVALGVVVVVRHLRARALRRAQAIAP